MDAPLPPGFQLDPALSQQMGTPVAVNAAKTHCPYGHEYDVVWRGRRTCKTCHNKQTAEGQRRRRARSAA